MSSKKDSSRKKKKMKAPPKTFSRAVKRNRKFRQQVDTNIVSIPFDVLNQEAKIAAGDAVFCEKCSSVFNKHSKLTNPCDLQVIKEDVKMEEDEDGNILPLGKEDQEVFDEDEQVWTCEF